MANEVVNKVVYGNNTLIDLTGDTVAAGDVLSGKTFHTKNGASSTGNMTNNGAVSGTISTKAGTYTIPSGYHNGSGSVAITSAEQNKIVAGNIKSGITILGVAGSVSPAKEEQTKSVTATTSTQTVSPDTGKVLSSVTVNPQTHSTTYTPAANTSSNNMGANHNYRYVDTSGLYRQSGTLTFTYNCTSTTNVSGSDTDVYKTINVSVPSQTPQIVASQTAGCKGSTSYTLTNMGSDTRHFYDTNYFSSADGVLTVKKAFYADLRLFVTSGRNSSGTTIYGYMQLRINGTAVNAINTNSSNNTASGNYTKQLAVGDVISVYTKVNTGSASAYTTNMLVIKVLT